MRFRLRGEARLAMAALLCVLAAPALSHHSTAEFDYTKDIVLSGVVKEVQWTNPHSYIQVLVPAATGTEQIQWGVEIGAPGINVRMGWRKDSVKVGDKITLHVAPARDGRKFCTLRFLTYEDGRRLDGVALNIKGNASFN
jgi:Family of unknown function (DUF6152)